MKMKTTRSTLLVLALAALVIGLVIVLGLHLDRAIEDEIVTSFSQRQLLLAEQAACGIQSVFDKAQQYLLHFKDAPGPARLADALAVEDEEGIVTWRGVTGQGFSGCLRSHPNYTQIRYIDAGGQEIVVVDRDGETVRVVPQDELRSQAEREFFIATQQLDEGEIYVSPLEPALGHGGVGAGQPTVRLATPIFDSQGRRQGIIVINLMPCEIEAHIARLSAEEGVDAWAIDETGVQVINVTHPEREGSNAYEYCQQTGDETLIALTEDMMAGGRGTGIYLWPESEGGPLVVKKLLAYAPVHPAEDHVWPLAASVTYDSVLAAHRQTHTMSFFLGGSITVIILAVAALVIRSGYKRTAAEEQARRSEELESLREISLAISAQLELDELLRNIVERGCRLLGIKAGGIYLVDETRGDLELIVCHGYERNHIGARIAPEEGLAGKVLQSGEPLAVNDYGHWEGRSPDWEAEPLTAVLGVPLKHGKRVTGVLEFAESGRTGGFDERDLRLATLFASQAAIAIENARLYEQAQRRLESLTNLNLASQSITSSLDVNEVLEQLVDLAGSVVNSDYTSVVLLDEAGEPVLGTGDFRGISPIERRIRSSGVTRHVLDSGQPVVVDTISGEGAMSPPLRQPDGELMKANPDIVAAGIRSFAAAPIQAKGKMMGVAFVHSRQPRAFHGQLALLTTFANQAAVALENARLYEQAQREIAERKRTEEKLRESEQRLKIKLDHILSPDQEIGDFKLADIADVETLQQIQDAFAQANGVASIILDLDANPITEESNYCELCHLIRQTVKGKTNCGQSGIVLGEKVAGTLEPAWHACQSCGLLEACAPIVVAGKHIANWFIGQSNTLGVSRERIRDYAEEIGADVNAMLAAFDEMIEMPIEKFEQILSLLWHVALELSTSAYNNLKLAKEVYTRKQAEEELGRRNRHLSVLQAVAATVSRSLSLDEILHAALDKVLEVTGLEAGGIQLLDESGERLLLEAHRGISEAFCRAIAEVRVADDPLSRQVLASDRPLVVSERGEMVGRFDAEANAEGLGSFIQFPLRSAGRMLGLMTMQSRGQREFSADEVALLTAIGDTVGVAIENARLYEQAQREIAERKRAEEALRTSELQYRTTLDSMGDAIHLVDPDLRFTLVNSTHRQWAGEFGSVTADIIGRNIFEVFPFLPDEVRDKLCDEYGQVFRTGETLVTEESTTFEDREFITETRKVPIFERGKVAQVVTVMRDITERRQMEEQLRRQERLAAVGQLAAGIAHDFRNLLSTIILYAQIPLRGADLPPDLAQNLETIVGESYRATDLVQQILDFSGRAMIERQPLDLAALTGEVFGVLRRTIPENIHITLDAQGAGPGEFIVEADAGRVQQALTNLAINARDAQPRGGELRIGLERIAVKPGQAPPFPEMPPLSSLPQAGGIEGGAWVCLTVSDTGTGMTEEARSHLFEPFFTTKEPGKGTGLGLAQVYGIVRQHEGYIGVETELGKGTTFRIYLPACEGEQDSAEEQVSAVPQGPGETILLVEDEEKLREATRSVLESLGYRVLTAANGREALEMYRVDEQGRRIDLVITDVVMPEMGGEELVQELRRTKPTLKALAITGYAVGEDVEELRGKGFLDVIHKPFDTDRLAQVIRRVLDLDRET